MMNGECLEKHELMLIHCTFNSVLRFIGNRGCARTHSHEVKSQAKERMKEDTARDDFNILSQ